MADEYGQRPDKREPLGKLQGGTLTPAFGRDYKNRASILRDLNDGRDFTMNSNHGFGYCSIRDLQDGCSFQVRDKSFRKVWTIKIQNGKAV